MQEGGYAISYAAYCLHASLEGVLQRDAGLADPLAYMQEDCSGLDEFIDRWRQRHATAIHRG